MLPSSVPRRAGPLESELWSQAEARSAPTMVTQIGEPDETNARDSRRRHGAALRRSETARTRRPQRRDDHGLLDIRRAAGRLRQGRLRDPTGHGGHGSGTRWASATTSTCRSATSSSVWTGCPTVSPPRPSAPSPGAPPTPSWPPRTKCTSRSPSSTPMTSTEPARWPRSAASSRKRPSAISPRTRWSATHCATRSPRAGTVNRGCCRCDADGWLEEVTEIEKLERHGSDARYPR